MDSWCYYYDCQKQEGKGLHFSGTENVLDNRVTGL
jgi:hypothetical protein